MRMPSIGIKCNIGGVVSGVYQWLTNCRPFCTSPEKTYSKQQAHSSSVLVRWLGWKLLYMAFHDQGSDAVLLVDAVNAFNLLNRQASLHNIRYLCHSIATVIISTYGEPTDLFVNCNSIHYHEGTTLGDPVAMPIYALALLPLI